MERSQSLDAIRCIGNYMIVLLHAWAAFQYVPWGDGEFVVWTFICSHLAWIALPTFFLISGYLLFRGFSMSNWPQKICRRLKRLVVPYICWNVLFVVFYLSLSRFVPRLAARTESFGLTTFSGAFSKIVSLTDPPIDGPLWFIRAIFLFSLASPILYLLMRRCRGLIALTLCFAWCIGETLLGLKTTLEHIVPAYAIAAFVIGGILAVNGRDLVAFFRPGIWVVLGFSACFVHAAISIPAFVNKTGLANEVAILLSFLSIAEMTALVGIVGHLPIMRVVNAGIYQRLREMSFFAYAGHFLFCSMWLHAFASKLNGLGVGRFSLLVLLFIGCGIPTIALVYWCAKRFCPRLLKFFDGTL